MLEGITISMNSQIPIIQDYLVDKIITLESVNKKNFIIYVKIFVNGNWHRYHERKHAYTPRSEKYEIQGELENDCISVMDLYPQRISYLHRRRSID